MEDKVKRTAHVYSYGEVLTHAGVRFGDGEAVLGSPKVLEVIPPSAL